MPSAQVGRGSEKTMTVSSEKLTKGAVATSTLLVIATAANYYLNLGWFGRFGKAVLAVALFCVVVSISRLPAQRGK